MSTDPIRDALAWLERPTDGWTLNSLLASVERARSVLRASLAQPPREPVAWFCGEPGNLREVEHWADGAFPVYLAAQEKP